MTPLSDYRPTVRSGRRRHWTIGGLLAGTASLAALLTLVVTLSQRQGPASTPPPRPSATNAVATNIAYPADVQANYLNDCELNSTPSACRCGLDWLQRNVPLAALQQDELAVAQGVLPVDLVRAREAC